MLFPKLVKDAFKKVKSIRIQNGETSSFKGKDLYLSFNLTANRKDENNLTKNPKIANKDF